MKLQSRWETDLHFTWLSLSRLQTGFGKKISESESFSSPEEGLPPTLDSLGDVTIEPSRKCVCSEVGGGHMSLCLMHIQDEWPTKLHSHDKNKPSLPKECFNSYPAQEGSLLGQVMASWVSLRCHCRGRNHGRTGNIQFKGRLCC